MWRQRLRAKRIREREMRKHLDRPPEPPTQPEPVPEAEDRQPAES
jgi:hypothetical protein